MSVMPFGDPPIRRHVSYDAIVVIPGIMGSELVDTTSGRCLWGIQKALGYAFRWADRPLMGALAVTDEERVGQSKRVAATRLLAAPHLVPAVGGLEPYGQLVKELRSMVAHPAAVTEFPYDWRLSVRHNASLLAEAMSRHLNAWRKHGAYVHARRLDPSGRDAQLVLVAHSMGGLLARALGAISGATEHVRATVTLGTPFHGSIKALQLLANGSGAPLPLPRERLRDVARTMPGVYDLLPSYQCRRVGDQTAALTPDDILLVGGDQEIAASALGAARQLADVPLPGHVLVAGMAQPTAQSVELADGVVCARQFGYRRDDEGELVRDEIGRPIQIDYTGDGTVYLNAARLPGIGTETFAQQHGALVRTRSILGRIRGAVVDDGISLGATLGESQIGLDLPEMVRLGEPVRVAIRETAPDQDRLDPAGVSCVVQDAASEEVVAKPRDRVSDPADPRTVWTEIRLHSAGLYRVAVSGGSDPVAALVLVTAGDADRA
jgi:hypothetical protein